MTALCKLTGLWIVFLAFAGMALAGNTYTTIDYPGAIYTEVDGINSQGDMVGFYQQSDRWPHGFLLSGGVFTPIDFPGASGTSPYGINDSGQIVGVYYDSDSSFHGFTFDGNVFAEITQPGGGQTLVYGINNSGAIIGSYYDGQASHGFILSNGNFTTLDPPGQFIYVALFGINNTGGIVGLANPGTGTSSYGFRYGHGVFKPLRVPGAVITWPRGVNDSGVIVGFTKPPIGTKSNSCFTFVGGQFHKLTLPGKARRVNCLGINNPGQIVGEFTDEHQKGHGSGQLLSCCNQAISLTTKIGARGSESFGLLGETVSCSKR